MSMLTFTDGIQFNLSGELRTEQRNDGWYVVGNGMLIPVDSQESGNILISQLKGK